MDAETSDFLQFLIANRGDYTLQTFDERLVANPNNIEMLLGRSAFLSKLKRYLESIEGYTQAITICSGMDLATAYAGRAFGYYQLKEYQKALNDCEQALELNPSESILWKTKGGLLLRFDKDFEALAAWDRGLKLNPSDEEMIGFRESLIKLFQNKLGKIEDKFRSTIKGVVEEIKNRSAYNSDDLDESDNIMKNVLETYRVYVDAAQDMFKEVPSIFEERDECSTMYYFVKAIDSGLNAIYPSFKEDKLEDSREFFEKAKEFAKKDSDDDRLGEIISIQYLLEGRVNRSRNETYGTSTSSSSSSISSGSKFMIALGVGAFSLILLLAGQWLIGLIGIGIAYWLWQS